VPQAKVERHNQINHHITIVMVAVLRKKFLLRTQGEIHQECPQNVLNLLCLIYAALRLSVCELTHFVIHLSKLTHSLCDSLPVHVSHLPSGPWSICWHIKGLTRWLIFAERYRMDANFVFFCGICLSCSTQQLHVACVWLAGTTHVRFTFSLLARNISNYAVVHSKYMCST